MEKLLPHYFNVPLSICQHNINCFKNLHKGIEQEKCYWAGWHYLVEGGIETDDSKLKTISITIPNWNREVYIPYIINMYYFQDYPKDKLELIVIDDDSLNKEAIKNMMKEQAKLYPELKIRFIQNYKNIEHGAKVRRNIGMRNSKNEIIIINESDTIPLNANFLRGICFSHNLREKIHCIPLACSVGLECCDNPQRANNIMEIFNRTLIMHSRLGHDYITSLDRITAFEMRGYSEAPIGHGGGEGNLVHRLTYGQGLIHANLEIMSVELPNFPQEMPNFPIRITSSGEWDNLYQGNDENWGYNDSLMEFDLYV